jgi:mono/diheme cytochrome c family protein
MRIGVWTVLASAIQAFANVETARGQEPIDFNRDIRPILSENCFYCHGPDASERKGGPRGQSGLRLDTLEGLRADLGGHAAVVPGKPDESELIRRVVTTDEDDLMPPKRSEKRVTPEQVALLRRWIADGAKFSNHWAYDPPQRPELPEVSRQGWVRNGVDRFVLARLEKEGLTPQREADRRSLARRVALDLTGLPPTPEEVRALENDTRSDAFERFVDGLMSKETYGEHWARMWLDLARYADSAGYADDPPRTIWPYRDYVIRAFNRNLPFDQFTIEQLAGDLLDNPTEEQLKATAFHRNTMTNSEGGTSDEEFRNVAVVDRVNTTFAVWMGTSMACAQCHTHKYDPISQKEYFQLFAFLNNTADADRPDEAPLLEFDSEEVRAKKAALNAEIANLDSRFQSAHPDLSEAARQWARIFPTDLRWRTPRPVGLSAKSGATLNVLDDDSVLVTPKGTNVLSDTYTVELPFDSATVIHGVRLEALIHESLEGKGPGLGGNFVVRQVRAKILPVPNQAGATTRFLRLEKARAGGLTLAEVQAFSGGENVAIAGTAIQSSTRSGAVANRAVDGRTEAGEMAGTSSLTLEDAGAWWELDLGWVRPIERIVLWAAGESGAGLEGVRVVALDEQRKLVWEKPSGRGTVSKRELAFDLTGPRDVEFVNASADHNDEKLDAALVATDSPQSIRYRKRGEKGWSVSGATGRDHALFLATGQPVEIPRGATLSVTISQQSGADRQTLGRFRVGVTGESRAAEYVDTPPAIRAALALPEVDRDAKQREAVVEHFVRDVAPGLRNERERYASVLRERDELKSLVVPVLRELQGKDRRVTKIQLRGNFLTTSDEVTEGVPAIWPPLPAGAPMNRLTLARWLVSPENPLTARVVANRLWEQVFGNGIVRTSEEFGSQGEPPVNQALLDWLAVELRDGGWDVKRFLKLLVTSAAYRQSSKVTPEALEKDPDNRWVSRGPRFRLAAEMVRDQALAAAGLLSGRMYGPSVRPPRPNLDLRAAFGGNLDWQPSPGEDRYRRGVYTEWRRTSPYPSMATFDAPSREVCTLRRSRSNTPLQALVTLNDPVFVEAAQGLARRMCEAGSSAEARLGRGFEAVLSREPSGAEVEELKGMLAEVRTVFAADPKRAELMAGEGKGASAAVMNPVELASWTVVANVLLNLDETLMKR